MRYARNIIFFESKKNVDSLVIYNKILFLKQDTALTVDDWLGIFFPFTCRWRWMFLGETQLCGFDKMPEWDRVV